MIEFLASVIKFSTVFLFGATGEIINQKSGHLNMGTPGIVFFGGLGGVIGERIYIVALAGAPMNNFMVVFMPIIFAILFGALGGLIFSFFTVTLHCNQNVTGLTLTMLLTGVACFFMDPKFIPMERMSEAGSLIQNAFSWYGKLGWFGRIFLSQSWFTYLGIIVAVAAAIIIAKTKVGLHLRAVGENASSADSAGINVNTYRYIATIIGGAIAAIGGAFYTMDKSSGQWTSGVAIDEFGWLALCIVIFSMWKPTIAIFASFGFAALSVLPTYLSTAGYLKGVGYMVYVFQLLPYIATLIVLTLTSILNSKRTQPPANLGVSYFREDR